MGSTTESGARDAFLQLVALARADSVTTASEAATLEQFRRLLGIPRAKARRYRRMARAAAARTPRTEQGRADLLAMAIRVAFSDGRACAAENRFLEELALSLRVERTTFARLVQAEEDRARSRRLQHRRLLIASAAVALVACAGVLALWAHLSGREDEMRAFQELERRYARSILLVRTEYAMATPAGRASFEAVGTGFFVRPDGSFVTNKHVVQPWKFSSEAARLAGRGYRLDEDSVHVMAWPGGSRFRSRAGSLREDQAFSTRRGNLTVLRTAPDAFAAAGAPRGGRHLADDNDLALLRCEVPGAVDPLPLAESSADVAKLDPVMAIGFPAGIHLLEGLTAECSPVVGRVRKAEGSLWVTTPLVGGNSGGPLLDMRGRVIGVATRIRGEPTLACCLRVEHVHRLLDARR